MRATARISCPRRQRFRYVPDLARPFERAEGRTLTRQERGIINALEKARTAPGCNPRFLVIDRGDFDSRTLLLRYQAWLTPVIDDAIVMAPTRPRAVAAVRQARIPASALTATRLRRICHSGNTPDHLRGISFTSAVLLDAHAYGGGLRNALRAIVSVLPVGTPSLMIIHSRCWLDLPPAFGQADPPPDIGITDLTAEPETVVILLRGPTPDTVPQDTHPPENEPGPLDHRRTTR